MSILRVWESLSDVTCCRSLVIVYDGRCVLQIGFAAASSSEIGEAVDVDANKLMQGSLYQSLVKSGARKFITVNHGYLLVFCYLIPVIFLKTCISMK